ncbi:hypothetical protein [Streptomyces sp. NPDC093984]|uniref:hypothetical protein n=1 Tax=Streptomyces sp. NPDC093984 TaxID=3366052 RepID=UPI0038277B79
MTRWIQAYFSEDDVLSYFELGDDGWALRQVDLEGLRHAPVTAAALTEVLELRDNADLTAMADYERKYGVLAEGRLDGWEDTEGAAEITEDTFERIWLAARHRLESADSPAEDEGTA